MTTLLNFFIPNTIPFINSGQELLEKQPMNTGLDCGPKERFVLSDQDPYYGKLALFDRFQWHYDNDYADFIVLIQRVAAIRNDYLDAITANNKARYLAVHAKKAKAVAVAYRLPGKYLLILVNFALSSSKVHTFDLTVLPIKTAKVQLLQLFSSKGQSLQKPVSSAKRLSLPFCPGEMKIIELSPVSKTEK